MFFIETIVELGLAGGFYFILLRHGTIYIPYNQIVCLLNVTNLFVVYTCLLLQISASR